MFIKILMEKLRNMWSYILDEQETEKTGEEVVGDFSPANKHEPVDSSYGAQFMAKEVGVVLLMFLNTMNLAKQSKQILLIMIGTLWNKIFQKRAIYQK